MNSEFTCSVLNCKGEPAAASTPQNEGTDTARPTDELILKLLEGFYESLRQAKKYHNALLVVKEFTGADIHMPDIGFIL